MIFASKYNNKFKVKTFHNVHICPQRKDNRLIKGPRIADKYEHIIRANPSWKLQNIKETVLLDMGVDVSLSKIKRENCHKKDLSRAKVSMLRSLSTRLKFLEAILEAHVQ